MQRPMRTTSIDYLDLDDMEDTSLQQKIRNKHIVNKHVPSEIAGMQNNNMMNSMNDYHMMGNQQQHMMGNQQQHMMGNQQQHMMGNQQHMMGNQQHMMGNQQHMMGNQQQQHMIEIDDKDISKEFYIRENNDNDDNNINCRDIVNHIMMCPICSKFYNNNNTLNIIIIIVLLVIILFLLKYIFERHFKERRSSSK
jgi:hypothetical protein